MSTTITKSSKAQQPSSPAKEAEAAPSQPIQLNATPASQAAQHAVPAVLAALFALRFNSLVADPVAEMTLALPVVVVAQVAYALVCLPVAGSGSQAGAKSLRKLRPGEKRKAGEGGGGGGPNYLSAALLSLILAILVTPFVYVTMTLFGAPVLTHFWNTFLCASHLAVLALFPIFYVHGVDATAWVEVAGFRAPFDETFGGLVGAVVGAWLGAVPIPLDWDREWQKWPVTILCGIYGGYVLGKLVGGTVLFGKRF